MNRVFWFTALSFALGLSAGSAKADLITYTFTGFENGTGTQVTGSFSYQTNSPGTAVSPFMTLFPNVGGKLTITVGGTTYSSTAVSGELEHNALNLMNTGVGIAGPEIFLGGAPGVFPNISSLPKVLNPAALPASTFVVAIHEGGPMGPDVIVATGRIRLDSAVITASLTPEPGGLILATWAAAGLAFGQIRRRGQSKGDGHLYLPAPDHEQ